MRKSKPHSVTLSLKRECTHNYGYDELVVVELWHCRRCVLLRSRPATANSALYCTRPSSYLRSGGCSGDRADGTGPARPSSPPKSFESRAGYAGE